MSIEKKDFFINVIQHDNWYEHCYSIYHVLCQQCYLYSFYDILKHFMEIQHPPFFTMAVIPAKCNFQIGSIAKDVLHDLYYNYAKVHAFTTFWTIVANSLD